MKFALSLVLLFGITVPAHAASPEEPVKSIMDLATLLWSDDINAEGKDYFDKVHLSTLYSVKFVQAYQAAAKYPIYEESNSPFGYDVITNGQDGCPLKDVKIEPGQPNNGVTDVKVTFKLWTCIDDGSADKNSISEVHFSVVEENGKPVIDDILRVVDGKQNSLVSEMGDIAKSGAEQSKGGKKGTNGETPPAPQN